MPSLSGSRPQCGSPMLRTPTQRRQHSHPTGANARSMTFPYVKTGNTTSHKHIHLGGPAQPLPPSRAHARTTTENSPVADFRPPSGKTIRRREWAPPHPDYTRLSEMHCGHPLSGFRAAPFTPAALDRGIEPRSRIAQDASRPPGRPHKHPAGPDRLTGAHRR